jgi:GNAT superfamily N-acetyltransferase
MAFCSTRGQFAAGWLGGGNQRRFAAMADATATPMGILASVAGEPVGWCACGPRSRYAAAFSTRNPIMNDREAGEDETVWLVPCLFVRAGHRAQGVTYALVRAAVDLARREGAVAIEGWPRVGSDRHAADAFLGRETMFAELGFIRVHGPSSERLIMRRELDDG